MYLYVSKIVKEVDHFFMKILNEGNSEKIISSKFESHWKELNKSLEDPENFEKKINILTKKWKPAEMAKWN